MGKDVPKVTVTQWDAEREVHLENRVPAPPPWDAESPHEQRCHSRVRTQEKWERSSTQKLARERFQQRLS